MAMYALWRDFMPLWQRVYRLEPEAGTPERNAVALATEHLTQAFMDLDSAFLRATAAVPASTTAGLAVKAYAARVACGKERTEPEPLDRAGDMKGAIILVALLNSITCRAAGCLTAMSCPRVRQVLDSAGAA
jgi:hypothetical protein